MRNRRRERPGLAAAPGAVRLPTALRRRGFRDLVTGQTVSSLGDWMGTVAFMALALDLTGSPTAVGGILALRLLPAALGGPLSARAAHRWDRRTTMLVTDATRAAMIAAVPLVRGLWWVYLWAFCIEVASLVFLPARDASIPDLVERDELPVANGIVLATSYGTIPLGAAAFALAAALPGNELLARPLALVFWIDAATYLVSMVFVARLTMLSGTGRREGGEDAGGFRSAFTIPLVRSVMPAAAAVSLGLGALFSLGIVFVREVLGASDAEFGVLIALFGVGAAGGLLALQVSPIRDSLTRTRLGVAAIGGIVAGFSLAPAVWVAYVGAVGFGGAASFTLASGMGTLQGALEGERRVLAFAAFHVVIRFGLALAAVGAGLAGDLVAAVDWPLVGRLEPSRVVLLCSGVLVFFSSGLVRRVAEGRLPGGAAPADRRSEVTGTTGDEGRVGRAAPSSDGHQGHDPGERDRQGERHEQGPRDARDEQDEQDEQDEEDRG